MACFISCRANCHGPYYPCPVWTCGCGCASNPVINPPTTPSIAFFALITPTAVADDALIPAPLSFVTGTDISSTTTGEAILTAGTYQVTYNVTSVIGADGTNSFGLTLNSTLIPASVTTVSGTAGTTATVSNTVTITVSSPSVLRLVNLSGDTVTVNMANFTIRKL